MFVIQSVKVWSKQICKISTTICTSNVCKCLEVGEHEGTIEVLQILTFDCNGCKRYFTIKRGLTLYQRSCKGNPRNRE